LISTCVNELPFIADVLQPFTVRPAIADPSAFVHHAITANSECMVRHLFASESESDVLVCANAFGLVGIKTPGRGESVKLSAVPRFVRVVYDAIADLARTEILKEDWGQCLTRNVVVLA
jgi:hypothetical protein